MDVNRLMTWLMTFLFCAPMHDICGFRLTILHTGDVGSRIQEINEYNGECNPDLASKKQCFGGAARIKFKVDEIRTEFPDTILLDAGNNMFQGSMLFYMYGAPITARFMNILGYDAMALGNFEFDKGAEGLKPFLDRTDFPVLSCNTVTTKTPEIKSLNKSVVLDISGNKIGIIGYTTPRTATLSLPGKITFKDEIDAIKLEVSKLKKDGIDVIIGLGHSGFVRDKEIARQVDGLDVVVGAHSYTFLYTGKPPNTEKPVGEYPTIIRNVHGQYVPVLHAYAYGKYLGFAQLDFENGVAKTWKGNPILLNDSVRKDPEVVEVIKTYLPELESKMNEKLGHTLVDLLADKLTCRLRECNIGNLIMDAFVHQHLRYTIASTNWNYIAISLLISRGIRTSIIKGDILLKNVLKVMPFKNTIDKVELNGQVIWDMLEHSAYKWEKDGFWGGFLQMSGLRVVYDMRRKPGKRVVQALALCTECTVPEFQPLEMSKPYNLLVSSFMVNGGNGFSMIKENMGKSHVRGDLDSHLIANFIKANSPLNYGLDGRIQFLEDIEKSPFCLGAASIPKVASMLMLTSLIAVTNELFL